MIPKSTEWIVRRSLELMSELVSELMIELTDLTDERSNVQTVARCCLHFEGES